LSQPESREEAVERAKASTAVVIHTLDLPVMDKIIIRRVLMSGFPEFCGEMHVLRSEQVPPDIVQTACEILLTNILHETVSAIAPPEEREALLRSIIKSVRAGTAIALAQGK
jgi:hypothetical protein